MCAICPANLIFLDLITVITSGEAPHYAVFSNLPYNHKRNYFLTNLRDCSRENRELLFFQIFGTSFITYTREYKYLRLQIFSEFIIATTICTLYDTAFPELLHVFGWGVQLISNP